MPTKDAITAVALRITPQTLPSKDRLIAVASIKYLEYI